eukprot:1850478-Amphidinium_carterae.1
MVDTRWIHRWKIQEGKKQIKARVTLRGFMDRAADGTNYTGTANKTAQRIVSSACMWHPLFRLSSIDISSAFARGMTFKELDELGDAPRTVEMEVSAADAHLVRLQTGFSTFNEMKECLLLIKPVYGLKDAPRAWERRLRNRSAHEGMPGGAKTLLPSCEGYSRQAARERAMELMQGIAIYQCSC